MPHILKNKNLEVQIDLPDENYNLSRFDWTGKIVKVNFKDIPVSTVENIDHINEHHFGKGFYNEFDIDTALGFDETEIGDWFHKIGIGLLKKDDETYLFNKAYQIKPAKFKIETKLNCIVITCKSQYANGYSYILEKEILLNEYNFIIKYNLQNTGIKNISTSEYVHNFIAINEDLIGSNYTLKFPFNLKPERFIETVNTEQKVRLGQKEINFNDVPNEQFFFSNLSGNEEIKSEWELTNLKSSIKIKETGNFKTSKVNLWGWKHVISPELFFNVSIKPGESSSWSRSYNFYNT